MLGLAAILVSTVVAQPIDYSPEGPGKPARVQPVRPIEDPREAFSMPFLGLSDAQIDEFILGRQVFNTDWAATGPRPEPFDGLGPVFTRTSCVACHRANGRGRPPTHPEQQILSMVVRLSEETAGGLQPHSRYGKSLDYQAVPGVPLEGKLTVEWESVQGKFADGERYELRKPRYRFSELGHGELPAATTRFSPRLASPVFGMGLLEAVPAEAILSRADPEDANRDGISGRANWIEDGKSRRLGRFGWKANEASLLDQVTAALVSDMGITSRHRPVEDCAPAQRECAAALQRGPPEIDARLEGALLAYMDLLAVPAPKAPRDAREEKGARLFRDAGCAQCHVPALPVGTHPRHRGMEGQIAAYTDLLLHDLGEELADGRPDRLATGTEWRTAPLWALGRNDKVNGHTFLLHDGRARGPLEAVLWHGGEGAAARSKVMAMTADERSALVAFLETL